jgi:surfeit locus 1 family protein
LSSPASLASRFRATALTPRWIAALVLALAIAAGFAALGQWQLGRSVDNAQTVEIDTETAVPLTSIAEPGHGVTETELGRVVTVNGELEDSDYVTLTGRSLDGRAGTWLVGHLVTDDGISLAVGLGFLPEGAAVADLGIDRTEWVGRYLLSEEPQSSDFEAGEFSAMSVPALVNLWSEPGGVYGGFLIADGPPPGYEQIVADAPEREVTLNLLNVFYAIEWVLFAGFAIYLWYRLVRDVVERQDEELAAP